MNRPISFILLYLLVTTSANAQQPDLRIETSEGLRLLIHSQLSPLQINRIHSWHVKIIDAHSKPVTNARVAVTGGMPEHDHGLPTQPRVTEEINPGTYLLEGVRFHMPGKWSMVISIETEENLSTVSLDFDL